MRWVIYQRTRKRVLPYETALASPRVNRFDENFRADLERRLAGRISIFQPSDRSFGSSPYLNVLVRVARELMPLF